MLKILFFIGDVGLVYLIASYMNMQMKLPRWKVIIYSFLVVPIGYFCSKLMRLIEAGTWEGFSFYGAVFFEPLIMILIGFLLGIKSSDMFDLGATSACISLFFLKIQCKITGCCYGKILRYLPNGRPIRFPSQIIEMMNGIVLLFVMLYIYKNKNERGYSYAWFMFLYGISRFILNLFRDTEPFVLNMSAGCFWSIISVIIGGTVLYLKKAKEKRYVKK